MTPVRCPSCHAALTPGAQWCTLCYVDLRPPQPAEEPATAAHAGLDGSPELVSASQGQAAQGQAGHSGLADPPATPRPAPVLTPHPILDGPLGGVDVPGAPATPPVRRAPKHALPPEADPAVMSAADVAVGTPGWPCDTCGAVVRLDLTECPRCGSGFMAAAANPINVKVPGIGNITQLSTVARVGLMIGGAAVVTAVFFLVLLVLGHIF